MSFPMPPPSEQQGIIDQLIQMNLIHNEWNRLARSIDQLPENVYAPGTTNPDKAESIVAEAVRQGMTNRLSSAISELRLPSAQLHHGASKLDTQIAFQVGKLYSALLKQLDAISVVNDIDTSVADNASTEDFTEFHEKLRDKAKFSIDNQKLAVDSKNDNSVLKRKASKLGFDDQFNSLNKKVRVFYSTRILANFPPQKYNADVRLNQLVDALFSILPDEFQTRDDILDHIYGVIFDATFQCLIFNE